MEREDKKQGRNKEWEMKVVEKKRRKQKREGRQGREREGEGPSQTAGYRRKRIKSIG